MQIDRFDAAGAGAHRKFKGTRILLLALTILAGCAAGSGTPSASSPPPSPDENATPSPRRSFELSSPAPSRGSGANEEIVGTLGADAVEGGCAYLETADGTRYEVIYPPGWRISAAPLSLTSPEGEVVATGGETITVRGRETDEMMTICQIGPVFVAEEVVSVE